MNPSTPGWQTSEFWLALGGIAAKFIIVLVIFGVIPVDKQEGTTQAIVNLIVAIGGIVGISTGTVAYGRHRTEIKKKMLDAQAGRQVISRMPGYARPGQPGVRR